MEAPATIRPTTIRPIHTRSDRKRFIDFPYTFYKGHRYWVPSLRRDAAFTLNPKKNPFFEHGTMQLFLAEDDTGTVVGRVAGIVNGMHLKKYDDGIGFFGFFECIDDYDTAAALLDAAAAWLRNKGMTGVRGPANPSLNDTAGLLVDGFDRLPALLMPYNLPYYEGLLHRYGFERAMTMWAYYNHYKIVQTERLRRGAFAIAKPLLLWINDGLMAIFFFVVGLEIKREVLVGELSSPRQAVLPLAAAVGGMVVPALFYLAFNAGTDTAAGWGIPMATDIAFALGVLALLGTRAPLALKIFLTALAIVDDLGAVLVIAFFYTSQLSWTSLGVGALFLAALILANRLGVRRTAVYIVLGLGLWVAFLKSGVHATIAGVLLAMTIPARRRIDAPAFLDRVRARVAEFASDTHPGKTELTTDQRDAVHSLEVACEAVETPLTRMEHALHSWVAFGIMPVFALANAGVSLGGNLGAALGSSVSLGILFGLYFGKQLGVTAFAWGAVRLGWATLPDGVRWRQVYGVSLLTGIGFTMSLFVANLAFADASVLDQAKIAVFAASLLTGGIGYALLRATPPSPADASVAAPVVEAVSAA